MTKTVTDHMLRQALTKVTTTQNRNGLLGLNDDTENNIQNIQEKIVTKVCGSTMICEDGTEAELVSPMPCTHWKCLAKSDNEGVCTLTEPIGALIVTSEKINYCLGVLGNSDEFEVRFHVGKNEVRVNKDYININSEHLVVNGLEVKNDGGSL